MDPKEEDAGPGVPNLDPLAQDDALTLEAELRQALQHQRAAFEQAEETRQQMRRLMERARDLLKRTRSSASTHPVDEAGAGGNPPETD